MMANEVPKVFFRRGYQSMCPFRSPHSIARNLPNLNHHSIERVMSPWRNSGLSTLRFRSNRV
jgi:hypothetical protein